MTLVPSGRSASGDGAADLALFLDRDRHRAVLVGEEGAVLAVELPGDAPAVLAQGRRAAGEVDAGMVVEGDPAVGVGDVDRRGQSVASTACSSSCPRRAAASAMPTISSGLAVQGSHALRLGS